jgi:rSAM/selenodomain-associated transferase 1
MTPVLKVLNPRKPGAIPKGRCALAVMTKAPRPGEVKTRLTPPLTPQEAAELNTCFLRDIAATLGRVAREENAQEVAVYTPFGTEKYFGEILPAEFELLTQRGDALGERLIFATEDLFALGFEAICLINSDSPTVPPRVFAQAIQILSTQEDQIVLGPSEDGGYYLIGLNKMQSALFENIRWSTDRVLDQTRARAQDNGLKVHLLPPWYDVDNGSALRQLCRDLFAPNASAAEHSSAPATRAYLFELLQSESRARIWPNEER